MLEKLNQFELDNKIKLFTYNLPNSQFISINILVNIGTRDEGEDEINIAHLLEHTIFSGTNSRKDSKTISFELETLGGNMNAATTDEYTIYSVNIPYINFLEALDIISDIFINSIFNDESVNLEKGIVKQELDMKKDNNTFVVYDNIMSLIYDGNKGGLSKNLDQNISMLSSINRDKVVNFISKKYTNDNVFISVVGNISDYNVLDEVNKKFETKKYNKSEYKRDKIIINNKKNKIIKVDENVNQSNFVLAMESFPFKSDKYYQLILMSCILGGGEGSMLFQLLRNKLGIAYYVYSYNTFYTDNGFFYISSGIENSKFIYALEEIINMLNKFKKGNFTEKDLNRAKGYAIGGILSELESAENISNFILNDYIMLNKVRDQDEIKDNISSVKKEDIVNVFNEIYKNLYLSAITNNFYEEEIYDNILNNVI